MSHDRGRMPPQDPYYGQGAADPYAQTSQPSDPYFGGGGDPYGQPPDPNYAQQQAAWYAQQQAWYAQQQSVGTRPPADARRGRGGAGAAIIGLILVLFGVWILFGDQIAIEFDLGEVWPMAAVALGVVMVVASLIPARRRS